MDAKYARIEVVTIFEPCWGRLAMPSHPDPAVLAEGFAIFLSLRFYHCDAPHVSEAVSVVPLLILKSPPVRYMHCDIG